MSAKDDVSVQIRLSVGVATELRRLAQINRTSMTQIASGAVEVLLGDRDLRSFQRYLGLPEAPFAPEQNVTNSQLIAELVSKYRAIQGIPQDNQGDYLMIGRLYNQHGYADVLLAIERLGDRLAQEEIREPLAYLAGILARGGTRAGGNKPLTKGAEGIRQWVEKHKLNKEGS